MIKLFDVLKWMAIMLAVLCLMVVVVGLCYLVLQSFRENLRTRADMQAASVEVNANTEHLRQLNSRLATENDNSRRQIVALENNLTELQRQQQLVVDLALQLYQRQQLQGNQSLSVMQPNITVIVQQDRKASGTPQFNIPSRDLQVNNLSTADDTWQENCVIANAGNVVCFRRVNETSTMNQTTEVPSDGGEICEEYTSGRRICYHFEEI